MLFNRKEEKILDNEKLKKRKKGRAYKLMGDYCLLALAYLDALNFYKLSLEILKKNDDYLWIGGVLEGISASFYLKHCIS